MVQSSMFGDTDCTNIISFYLCFFREGIDWADIEWVDNVECLDLIEKVRVHAKLPMFCLMVWPSLVPRLLINMGEGRRSWIKQSVTWYQTW